MIIGISGAQGQGKSTLIKAALGSTEYNFRDGELQTARTLLSDMGYTLTEVNKYMPLKVKFQEQLLSNHSANIQSLIQVSHDRDDIYLVERTFADIFNYALLSLGPFNEYSEWLNEYYEQCKKAQDECFDSVVFLSGRDYTPEEDGVRSINSHFSALTDFLIRKYTMAFINTTYGVEITEPSVHGRLKALTMIATRLIRIKENTND